MKKPVELLTKAPFHCIFTDQSEKGSFLQIFLIEIARIVIEYSSKHQTQVLNNWFCEEICTNPLLGQIPVKQCTDLNCISSLCFLEKIFTIISNNNETHFATHMVWIQ